MFPVYSVTHVPGLYPLKRSSLGLDLYLWLTYRTFALRAPLRLSWRQVYRQFGVDPARASDKRTVQNFRCEVLRELKKIKLAWPGLNYTTAPGMLSLHPSTPAIAPYARPARGTAPQGTFPGPKLLPDDMRWVFVRGALQCVQWASGRYSSTGCL